MKNKSLFLLASLLFLMSAVRNAQAQGTAFTYQGRLTDNGGTAGGIYDLRFMIYDLAGGGSAIAGPLTNANVAVSNGLFTTALDFGAAAFAGAALWLEIGVRTNGSSGEFTTLTPRHPITATPYAIFAGKAAMLAENASQIFTGTIGFNPSTLGMPPFVVSSAVKVNNFNADLFDGLDSSNFNQCVETIAVLKALTPTTVAVGCVTVLGYHIRGDGGGGIFYWDASASESDNGGTILMPDSLPSTGRWKRMVKDPLSVKWFGATGNGSTDDTLAFEAAIELSRIARLPLEIPAGTYSVDTLYAIQDYAWIRGAGIQKTILKSRSGRDVFSKRTLRSAITIVIENLSIEGFGQTSNDGHGIAIPLDVNDTGSVTIRNVEITKCGGSGLRFYNTFHLLLEAVQISECGDHLFNLEGGNTTTLIRCYGRLVATGKAAYRIKSGRPVFIACNGIDGGTNADWGVFGANMTEDGLIRFCTPTFLGCNMEDFTHRGCHFKFGSFGNFFGATFVAPANTNLAVKALEYDYVSGGLPILDTSSYLVSAGASWLSNSAVHAVGNPFLNLGATLGGHIPIETVFNPSDNQTWQTPLATAYYAGSRKFALQLNRSALDEVQIGKLPPGGDGSITAHKTGTASWGPPLIVNGATASTTVTVSGAAVGDTVAVGFTRPVPAGALLAGSVTAPDTVTVTLVNLTGAALDLTSGILRGDVWKH